MLARQFRQAFTVVWLILAGLGLAAVVAPFAAPRELVLGAASACQSRHESCAFCGMTRAFLAIAAGDFDAAARLNRAALPLFAGALVNAVVALAFASAVLLRQRSLRRAALLPAARPSFHSAKESSCKS